MKAALIAFMRFIVVLVLAFFAVIIGVAMAGDALSDAAGGLIILVAPIGIASVWVQRRRRHGRLSSVPMSASTASPPVSVKSANDRGAPAEALVTATPELSGTEVTPKPPAALQTRPSGPQTFGTQTGGSATPSFLNSSSNVDRQFARLEPRPPGVTSSMPLRPPAYGWIAEGDQVTVAGRTLSGMVYIGPPPRPSGGHPQAQRGWIDPTLSVARPGVDPDSVDLPYWPSYGILTTAARGAYLDWLAGGRQSVPSDPGFMFMFFYGLERRFCLDDPSEQERRVIVNEVERLAALYPENNSVQRYLGAFLDVARVVLDPLASDPPPPLRSGDDLPVSLRVGLGRRLAEGERLDAAWARTWILSHPQHFPRQPARRCPTEFAALFNAHFADAYPEGMRVNAPKRKLKASYRAASGEFEVELAAILGGEAIPDVVGLRTPLQVLEKIADRCATELEPYSRLLGRKPDARGSLEADRLLPQAIRSQVPSPARDRVQAWARERIASGGEVTVSDALTTVVGAAPATVGKRELTALAQLLEHVGIGMAPDPRHALRWPDADGRLILYARDHPFDAAAPSARFRSNLIPLALGALVAQADGEVSPAERAALIALTDRIEGLTPGEHAALAAQLAWELVTPTNLALLRRRLKDSGTKATADLRAALVAAAQADGFVHAREVAEIEKLYRTLGLDPSLAYSDLHASDGPVTMCSAISEAPGEPIQPAPARGGLDPARLAAIRADTERVSAVLGDIFAPDEPEPDPEPTRASGPSFPGLDNQLHPIVAEILRTGSVSDAAFDALCSARGLLAQGTLEAINEWAFDTYDDALIERDEFLALNDDVAAAMRADLEEAGQDAEVETARA